MSKYDNYYRRAYSDLEYDDEQILKAALMEGEQVLWKGKPKMLAHLLNSVFSANFPFVMIWVVVDGIMISAFLSVRNHQVLTFAFLFFLVHLMPVWIWIFNIIKAAVQLKYKAYVVTNRRILIKDSSVLFHSVYYTDIGVITVHRGFADRLSGVGDIYVEVYDFGREQIVDIVDYAAVYDVLQKKLYDIRMNPAAQRQHQQPVQPMNFGGQGGGGAWSDFPPADETTQYYVNGVPVTRPRNGNPPYTQR